MADATHTVEDAVCIAETGAAIKVIAPGIGFAWIPKSQVHDESEVFELGGEGTLVVTQWWAEQKGWV